MVVKWAAEMVEMLVAQKALKDKNLAMRMEEVYFLESGTQWV